MSLLIEETKLSGFDWIGDIPSSWTVDRIKDIIPAIYGGGTPDSSHPEYWEDGDITWITPTDFQDFKDSNVISDSRRKITLEGLGASAATLLPVGSVVMASRATIGVAKIAGVQLCTNQGFVSFVCERASNKFLRYAIEDYLGDMFANIASGTTFREISRSEVRRTHYAFPCFAEQQRIVAHLDKACASIDGAIRTKRQQLEVLDNLRKSIIHKAVTRGLDDKVSVKYSGIQWIGAIPEHWKIEKLKRILAEPLMYGTNEAAELDDPDLPRYIRITDFEESGKLREDTFRSLPLDKAQGYYLSEDDLLFARSGATVGKSFIFKNYVGVACFAGYLIKARMDHRRLNPEFLYYYTKSPCYEAWKEQIFTQATIQNISATKYAYLPVVLPPLKEQRQIVGFLEGKLSELEQLGVNIFTQISALEQYRKSLIHECVTGKRRIE
jgi:type I restriction enzyme S subunit